MHRLLLEIYADHFDQAFDILYEPFVWDSNVIGRYPMDKAKEAEFGNHNALSQEGLYLHTSLPLFTDGDGLGDLAPIVNRYLKGAPRRPLLAKFIRANGRLGLLDKLYPNGRFLICLRNPLDVVNSVVTKFSFFGAEFHKNDYPRFAAEVARGFGVALPPENTVTPAYRAALWCHFMNLAAVKHAAGKANYKLIAYEDFAANRNAYGQIICDHVGVPYKPAYEAITAQSVGRVSKDAPVLTTADVAQIMPLFESYCALVADVTTLGSIDHARVLKKYAAAPERRNYVPRGFGWSPVKLESEVIKQHELIQDADRAHRAALAEVQQRTLRAESPRGDGAIDVSVIVTSFNNLKTIRQTVDSVRRQTYPVAEIIVADDGSTDGSRELLQALAAEEPRLRLLMRETNMGVSANRNDAIRQARHAFFSQLDGDDTFYPAKIEREARALQGRDDAVAFSDTMKLGPEEYWDCAWAAGFNGRTMLSHLVARRARLPRDMLMSRALHEAAGGYREGCSMYEDWGFKVRVAEKAKHWLYSGGPGTLYSPGGLSQVGLINHVYGGLWILCNDVDQAISRNKCWTAALAGLLRLMRVQADIRYQDEALEDVIGPKIQAIFEQAKRELLEKPLAEYAGREDAFFETLHRLLKLVGIERR